MIKLVKNLLLDMAKYSTALAFFPLFALVLVFSAGEAFLGNVDLAINIFSGGTAFSILISAIATSTRRSEITHISDYYQAKRFPGRYFRLLAVKDDKVEMAKAFWIKEWDSFHLIELPMVIEGEFGVLTDLVGPYPAERRLDEVVTQDVGLTFRTRHPGSIGFKSKELLTFVIEDGYWSVDQWLIDSFHNFASDLPSVIDAFAKHGKNRFLLADAIEGLMEDGKISFDPKLTNIVGVSGDIPNVGTEKPKLIFSR